MNAAIDMVSLIAPVKSFVGQPRQALIDGRWQNAQAGGTFEVFNPATEAVIAQVADCKKADVDLAVAAARKAFDEGPWPNMSPSARGKILWKIGDLILENLEELAQLESLNNGKPIGVARAADVPLAADLFHYMAGWATKIEGNTIPLSVPYTPDAQYHAYTRREPIGVVAQIIPWNFPLLMAAWKLGPVLTAGCTVVLKPAEETPLSALRAGAAVHGCGLAARGAQRDHRFWRDLRRAAGGASACRQGGLHRFDRGRQAHRQGGRQRSQESHARAGRQVAQHRARRRGSRSGHSRRLERDFLQSRPMLLRGLAAVRAAEELRSRARRCQQRCQEHPRGPRPRSLRARWDRWCRKCSSSGSRDF